MAKKVTAVEITKRQANKLNKQVEQYNALDSQIKALKEQQDAIRKAISESVEASGAEKVDTGMYVIHAHTFEKISVDTDALKRAGMYEQFSKTTSGYYFRIFDK